MNKKRLILIISIAISVLVAAVLFIILGGSKQSPSAPDISISATPTQTPIGIEDDHAGAEEAHQEEGRANPVLSALPHRTVHWTLDFNGSGDDKYLLLAKVRYVIGREDPGKKIDEQRPYIEAYLRSIGQPEGTYVIEYVPVGVYYESNS